MNLNESQISTITNALHVARERFEDHVRILRTNGNHDRLADQFERQAEETQEIANLIENATTIILED